MGIVIEMQVYSTEGWLSG